MSAPVRIGGAALGLCIATLAISWPGVSMYDSVWQYEQALSGRYNDWHPPVMAWLWAMLHPLGRGAAPMFVLQILSYWLGIGLWACGIARTGRWRAAICVLVVGACPLFLGWQVAVLKDAQMTAALLAGTGLIAWWRLADRAVPIAALFAAGGLLLYAVSVRSNALFAVVPLVMMLTRWKPLRRITIGLAALMVVLAVSPFVNTRVIGAEHSNVTHAQPLFDLAGIAHFGGQAGRVGLHHGEHAMIATRHCYTPFFWDPLGDGDRCGTVFDRWSALPAGEVGGAWAAAILHHPFAYVRHRLAHLNSTWRFIVPFRYPSAAPPLGGEPNSLGLRNPGPAHRWLALSGAMLAETPVGWPIAWIMVAAGVLFVARTMSGPARDLALALAVSALMLEASFAVISIASDLRYHLWSMIAAALAAILIAHRAERRDVTLAGAAVGIVVGVAIVARLALPVGPLTYRAMLG
ncbi:hypothetical protein [Sphingomonas aliaeris]|uniref:hypothetical protein n=1 Tax=Sphingomonas aliaeris TaxID=2759526 RepID=UPI001CEC4730|nr:hypothetical protein [Sphingomonas aliaeris]